MFNKKTFWALTAMSMLLTISCEKTNDNITDDDDTPIVDVIYPFKGIIISGVPTNGSATASMNIMDFDGDTTYVSEVFNGANGEIISGDPKSITLSENRIYFSTVNNLREMGNHIYVINREDYKLINSINLGDFYVPSSITLLTNGSLVVTGTTRWGNQEEEMLVISNIESADYSITKIEHGRRLTNCKQIGNKLFITVPSLFTYDNDWNEINLPAQLISYDIDNIVAGEHHVVSEEIGEVSTIDDNFFVDANNKLWIIGSDENDATTLFNLDTESNSINTKVVLYAISNIDGLSATLSKDKSSIYIRSLKSIYAINLNNPVAPIEPIAAITGNFANISALTVAPDGNVLMLSTVTGSITNGTMYEFTPSLDGSYWDEAKTYDVTPHGRLIVNLR